MPESTRRCARVAVPAGALVLFNLLLLCGPSSWADAHAPGDSAPPRAAERSPAACEPASAATASGIEVRLSPYPGRDMTRSGMLRLDIAKLPDGFFTDLRASIQLIAWTADPNGSRQHRTPAVRLFFVNKDSGQVLRATPIDRISRNTIDAAIGMGQLDSSRYNQDNFLQSFALLATGLDDEWEGVTLKVQQGGEIVTELDAPLPALSQGAGFPVGEMTDVDRAQRAFVQCVSRQ